MIEYMSYITIHSPIHSPIHSATCRGSYLHLHGVVQAINCYCTRPGFPYHLFWYTTFIIPLSYVWVYVNDNEKLHRQWFCVVGGKEAEASGCKYLQGPCKTNEECPPACVAKGYTSGALCSIDPSTRATRCCCFVP